MAAARFLGGSSQMNGLRRLEPVIVRNKRLGLCLSVSVWTGERPSAAAGIKSAAPIHHRRRFCSSEKGTDEQLRAAVKCGVEAGLSDALKKLKSDVGPVVRFTVIQEAVNAGVTAALKDSNLSFEPFLPVPDTPPKYPKGDLNAEFAYQRAIFCNSKSKEAKKAEDREKAYQEHLVGVLQQTQQDLKETREDRQAKATNQRKLEAMSDSVMKIDMETVKLTDLKVVVDELEKIKKIAEAVKGHQDEESSKKVPKLWMHQMFAKLIASLPKPLPTIYENGVEVWEHGKELYPYAVMGFAVVSSPFSPPDYLTIFYCQHEEYVKEWTDKIEKYHKSRYPKPK